MNGAHVSHEQFDFRRPLPHVIGSPDLGVLSAGLTSVRPSDRPRLVGSLDPTPPKWGTWRISLVHMEPFDCMPAVRTPEAPLDTCHGASKDSAFPIGRQGRLLQPGSISGLSLRSLAFRPTASLSTLRNARYRTPRKTRYAAAGSALPRPPFQAAEFHALARRNPHTTRRAGPHRAVPRACRAVAGRSMITHSSLTNRKGSPGSGSSAPRRHSTHPVGYLMHDEHTGCPYLLWVRPFTVSSRLREALGYYGLC